MNARLQKAAPQSVAKLNARTPLDHTPVSVPKVISTIPWSKFVFSHRYLRGPADVVALPVLLVAVVVLQPADAQEVTSELLHSILVSIFVDKSEFHLESCLEVATVWP